MTPDPPPDRLRLTLVTETFPPEVNGVARTLGRWVDTFRARGHTVRVVRPRQPGEPRRPGLVRGVPLPFYPKVRVGLAGPLRTSHLLSRTAPDLVHVATEGPLGWSAVTAAARLGLPAVTSFHTNYDHYVAHYGFAGLERVLFAYLRWVHNQAALTLAPSEATRRRLLDGGVRNVEIWGRGVDAEAFHPARRDAGLRRELGLGDGGVLLLYVGRLAAEKNLPALLEAFARLRRRPGAEGWRLALVGDGPLRPQLEARQAPGVTLAGERHGADLARWFASGDVFAFPSRSETFGNVVLEAQASGLPVAGYDVPALRERVTPGADGLLVPEGGDFAAALWDLGADPWRRAGYGRTARAKAERQGWPAVFDRLEGLYRRVIAEHAARGPWRFTPPGAPSVLRMPWAVLAASRG
jgi:glycosyltransferase involved in cell wall biosynthesis